MKSLFTERNKSFLHFVHEIKNIFLNDVADREKPLIRLINLDFSTQFVLMSVQVAFCFTY